MINQSSIKGYYGYLWELWEKTKICGAGAAVLWDVFLCVLISEEELS